MPALPECSHCAQPMRIEGFGPNYCPACGWKWRAAPPPGYVPAVAWDVACPLCARAQRPGFVYCIRCGAAMDDPGGAVDHDAINARGAALCRRAVR